MHGAWMHGVVRLTDGDNVEVELQSSCRQVVHGPNRDFEHLARKINWSSHASGISDGDQGRYSDSIKRLDWGPFATQHATDSTDLQAPSRGSTVRRDARSYLARGTSARVLAADVGSHPGGVESGAVRQ